MAGKRIGFIGGAMALSLCACVVDASYTLGRAMYHARAPWFLGVELAWLVLLPVYIVRAAVRAWRAQQAAAMTAALNARRAAVSDSGALDTRTRAADATHAECTRPVG